MKNRRRSKLGYSESKTDTRSAPRSVLDDEGNRGQRENQWYMMESSDGQAPLWHGVHGYGYGMPETLAPFGFVAR